MVEAVGKNGTRFHPGDEVFGTCEGSFAEYVCAHADRLAPKPANLTSEQARDLWMETPPGRTIVAVDGATVVGSAMGHHVIDWARRSGYRSIQFNAVVETNVVAVRLWRSLGFEVLATVPEAFDDAEHGLVGLHMMFLKL